MTWDPTLLEALERFARRTSRKPPYPSTSRDADELCALIDREEAAAQVIPIWAAAIARIQGRSAPNPADDQEAHARFIAALRLLGDFWPSDEGDRWLRERSAD